MSGLSDDSVLLLLALGVGLSLLLLTFALSDGGRKKQLQRIERVRARMAGATTPAPMLRRDAEDHHALDKLLRRLIPQPDLLRQRLARTGRNIGLGTYCLASLAVALGMALAIAFLGLSPLLAIPSGLLCGLWLPHLVVAWAIRRRAARFTQLFPDAIGLMVRGVKSGLPITETFQIVSQELGDPVGLEFRGIGDQIRLGQPIDRALADAAHRIATPEFNFLVVTLSVQRETGGNLAETLENLGTILRRRAQMRLKIRALSSEARTSALILGALPFVMIGIMWLVSPNYISALFTTSNGYQALWFAGVSMLIGILIMAKMVRFEI